MPFDFAFNHDELVTLNQRSAEDVIISLINVHESGGNEMHAIAFKESEPPLTSLTEPLTPIGCPYPPGWTPGKANLAVQNAEYSPGSPVFRISAESLQKVLDANQFMLGGSRQVLSRMDGEIMGGMLKTFFRVSAYTASGNRLLQEERTH